MKSYVLLVATIDRAAQLLGTVVLIQEVVSNLLKVLEMGTGCRIGKKFHINGDVLFGQNAEVSKFILTSGVLISSGRNQSAWGYRL